MTKWAMTLMTGTAFLPAAASAQTAVDDARSGDIIVTAQRYEQRLQDVPLSVSVLGAKELAGRAVTDLADLQYSVPGLSIYDIGVGRQNIQLRGISNTQGSAMVGIYLDETPLASDVQGDAFNVRLLDMERVEVLRGPQATLYGQGSMGGTIRYIPAAPKLDAVGGSAEGEYSRTKRGADGYKAVGVVNLPLATDKLGLRLVGGYERTGGYIDRAVTGEKDINGVDIYTVRANLLAKPNDRLTLGILGLYQKIKQANQDFGVDYVTTSLFPAPTKDRYSLFQAKASYDLDFAELSGSASYIDRHNLTSFDLSPDYVPLLQLLGFPAGFIDQVGLVGTVDYKIYSGEVRLSSQSEGPLGWQLGATYRDQKYLQLLTTPTAPNPLPFALIATDDYNRSRSYALYGEVNYAFTPQLKATAGLRYFHDRRERDLTTTTFGIPVVDQGDGKFHSFNPRFNLSYAFTPDSMVFANVAKGFRAGGFNNTSAPGFVVSPTFDPDEVWTYEVGTKHQLFGNKLVLDAAVYRTEWSKVQSVGFPPGATFTIVTNSGRAEGWGVELGVTARPTRALTLTGTYGWNNVKFTKAAGDKAPGDPVDGAVRKSWSASADFRPPLSDNVNGILRVDYQHAGAGQFTLRIITPAQISRRPGRDIVNARIGAAFGQIEVALFAKNLFDENAPVIQGPFSTIYEDVEQRPRVIGIAASTSF
jgi:outer membrane receptor protein involved in Fe transport